MRVFKGIKKVASYAAVGGFGAVVIAGLAKNGSVRHHRRNRAGQI